MPVFLIGQNNSVYIHLHDNAYYNIFHIAGTDTTQVTKFKAWEEIEDLKVSPDQQYFFFRHRPKRGKIFELVVYERATLKPIAKIKPGFGGRFDWNDQHQIIHDWGCGTYCRNVVIYDLKLNQIPFYNLSSFVYFNQKKNTIVQPDLYGIGYYVIDLKAPDGGLKIAHFFVNYLPLGYRRSLKQIPVEFLEGNTVKILYPYQIIPNNALYFDLNKLDYEYINPEERSLLYHHPIVGGRQ